MVSAELATFSLKPCDLANTLHLMSSYILKPCICNVKIYHLSATHLSDCWTKNFVVSNFFILPYSLLLLDKEFQANLYLMSIQALEPWKVYHIFQSNLNQFENKSALRAKSWPCQLLDIFQQWKGKMRMSAICAGTEVSTMFYCVVWMRWWSGVSGKHEYF